MKISTVDKLNRGGRNSRSENGYRYEVEKGRLPTGGDVVEGDTGAGERVLHRGGDASGVAVGGDGDGAAVVHANEGGTDVLRDRVRIRTLGDVAVLDVPPHRYLRRGVLRLRVCRGSISTHDAAADLLNSPTISPIYTNTHSHC